MNSKHPSLLIVGHGSTISKLAEKTVRQHADRLSQTNRFSRVDVHFLMGDSNPPVLPNGDVFLVPFFMSDGYFTQTRIPEIFGLENFERHTAEQDIYQCDALGVDPTLASILSNMVDDVCATENYDVSSVDVVLISHGSGKSSASKDATEIQGSLLREKHRYRRVSSAYLEENPSLEDLLSRRGFDRTPVVVLGLFAAEGPHAVIDVPNAIARWRLALGDDEAAAAIPVHYAGVVGSRPEIVTLIEQSVTRRIPWSQSNSG